MSPHFATNPKLYKTNLLAYTKLDTDRYLFLLAAFKPPYPDGFIWSLPQALCVESHGSTFSLETVIQQKLGLSTDSYDLNYFDLTKTGMETREDEHLAIIEIQPEQFIALSVEYDNFTWCRDCECGKLQELYMIDLATFAILERGKQLIKNDFLDTQTQPNGKQNYQTANLIAA